MVEIKDIIKTYISSKKEQANINIFLSIIFIVIGAILLKYGGDFVVDYSVEIANYSCNRNSNARACYFNNCNNKKRH